MMKTLITTIVLFALAMSISAQPSKSTKKSATVAPAGSVARKGTHQYLGEPEARFWQEAKRFGLKAAGKNRVTFTNKSGTTTWYITFNPVNKKADMVTGIMHNPDLADWFLNDTIKSNLPGINLDELESYPVGHVHPYSLLYDKLDAYVITHSERFKNYYIETGEIDGGDSYVLITDLTKAKRA